MTKIKKTYAICETIWADGEETEEGGIYDACYGKKCAIEHLQFICEQHQECKIDFNSMFDRKNLSVSCEYYDDFYECSVKAEFKLIELIDNRSSYHKSHDLEGDFKFHKNGNIEIVSLPERHPGGVIDCFH